MLLRTDISSLMVLDCYLFRGASVVQRTLTLAIDAFRSMNPYFPYRIFYEHYQSKLSLL
jgi:hypothetical protein